MLASLILLIGAIFVYSTLLKPAYDEVNQLRGDLASKSEVLEDQKKVVAKVKELLSQTQTLESAKKAVSLVLPNREEYPTLINQLSSLARTDGLTLESINLSKSTFGRTISQSADKTPVVSVLQASLSVKGPYQSLKNFIQKLETNIRVMDLKKITVIPGAEGSGDNFSYNLVVNVYYQTL